MGATLRSQSESPSRDGDDEDEDDYDDNDDNINLLMKCLYCMSQKSSLSQSFLYVCYVLFSLSRMLSLSVCLSHFILTYSSGAPSGLSV